MALPLKETPRRDFRFTDAMDVDQPVGESRQPVRRSPGIRGHSRQAPERHQDGALRTRRVLLKERITLSAQSPPPIGVPDSFRLKQSIKEVVLVEDREVEAGRQPTREGRLSASRQTRDQDERSVHSSMVRTPLSRSAITLLPAARVEAAPDGLRESARGGAPA
jgi:hypothetical protein